MNRIFLIGYMGVGKTTTGKELAKSMDLEFVDLDHFIQNRYNKTIAQLFDEYGEERFREIENAALKEIAEFENVVISTGGGAPCFHNNIDIMNESGLTVYLKTDPQTLSKRLNTCKEKRPLIRDKNEDELLIFVTENIKKREPFYHKAQIVFETDELINREDVDKYVQLLKKEFDLYFGKKTSKDDE